MKHVSGKEMCKALERNGWSLKRVSGSHHVYTRAGSPKTVSVPVHANKILKAGTQRKIMKDAGFTDQDLA